MMKYLLIFLLALPVFSNAGYTRHHDCKKFESRALILINKQSIQIELLKKRLIKIEPPIIAINHGKGKSK